MFFMFIAQLYFRKQSMLCDIVCSKSMKESLLSD